MKDKLKEVEASIATTRNALHDLIENSFNLNKPEVVKASQELDKVLNEYNQVIRGMENNI